ncbi:uncharacterized protein [Cicer arietinum]|uniref:uncharacterized protein n=1 Tax=Cicer arietinum TaxID=3827 RepID=UPI003CC54978
MATHNKILETQITQVAQQVVSSSISPGVFPGKPEPNPKGKLNDVTLRSEKQLEEPKGSDVEVNVRDGNQRTQPSKIFSNKIKLDDNEKVALTEECSAIIQNKFPPKLKDPKSFYIPCVIGDMSFERALCDLGASVSLMPLSVYKKFDVGELKPTNISLQLDDRSIKYPVGILEDVPIKVGQLFIPADFLVLEMEEDPPSPNSSWETFSSHNRSCY